MKVRRVYWIHHLFEREKCIKKPMASDFPVEVGHEDCKSVLYSQYGFPPQNVKQRFESFAEVISSGITEDKREVIDVDSPKHFGTDLLLNPVDFAATYDASKDKRKTRRVE